MHMNENLLTYIQILNLTTRWRNKFQGLCGLEETNLESWILPRIMWPWRNNSSHFFHSQSLISEILNRQDSLIKDTARISMLCKNSEMRWWLCISNVLFMFKTRSKWHIEMLNNKAMQKWQ
jgi:hypothetical protein